MSDRSFFDTDVLVYLFDEDAPAKQAKARALVEEEAERGGLVVSTQVLQEFYVTVTRKLGRPLPGEDALEAARALGVFPVVQIDPEMVYAAADRSLRSQISLWDALILQAARVGGCERVWSEDLQDGQVIDGVRIRNPFAALSG